MQGESELEREAFLLQLAQDGTATPEQPEPLYIYRRFRRYGMPTYSGGLFNQPHIQLLEFDTVESAIAEHEAIRAIKQAAKQSNSQSIGG